jgi:hypothetical protein
MNPKIEISSLVVNKLKISQDDFQKYDIDVALDEVESLDTSVKLKYKFALLSNPPNTKISTEGFVTVFGNESETAKFLSPDERNIPVIVNTIYQEIYPFLYIISKSMQIPCPAYRLAQIASKQVAQPAEQIIETQQTPSEANQENAAIPSNDVGSQSTESAEPVGEEIIQEANVSTI